MLALRSVKELRIRKLTNASRIANAVFGRFPDEVGSWWDGNGGTDQQPSRQRYGKPAFFDRRFHEVANLTGAARAQGAAARVHGSFLLIVVGRIGCR